MISVEEALQRLLAQIEPVGSELVALPQSNGRVLAADLAARRSQPPFAASAMDGYAVRSADVAQLPVRLRVIGAVQAGGRFEGSVGAGEAIRIFTGAPVPDGADCVVLQEDVDPGEGGFVTVREAGGALKHVRAAGIDFREGDVLLRAGRVLGPRDVALAASMNHPWVPVFRRPRVAILPNGDELFLPGDPSTPDGIVSGNGYGVAALVERAGGDASHLGIARDDAEMLRSLAARAAGADLLVTIGGASVGEHDLVRTALEPAGLALDFWKIAMRPGKPLMVGRMGGTVVLGLPGNPASALVCAQLFLFPALARLTGRTDSASASVRGRAGAALKQNDRRQDYLRATVVPDADEVPRATPLWSQDSSLLSVFAAADALIVRPPHAPAAAQGDPIDLILLDRC